MLMGCAGKETCFAEMLYLLQQTASRLYADPTFILKSFAPPLSHCVCSSLSLAID
jgi:hypothetical protein